MNAYDAKWLIDDIDLRGGVADALGFFDRYSYLELPKTKPRYRVPFAVEVVQKHFKDSCGTSYWTDETSEFWSSNKVSLANVYESVDEAFDDLADFVATKDWLPSDIRKNIQECYDSGVRGHHICMISFRVKAIENGVSKTVGHACLLDIDTINGFQVLVDPNVNPFIGKKLMSAAAINKLFAFAEPVPPGVAGFGDDEVFQSTIERALRESGVQGGACAYLCLLLCVVARRLNYYHYSRIAAAVLLVCRQNQERVRLVCTLYDRMWKCQNMIQIESPDLDIFKLFFEPGETCLAV